MGRVEMSTRLFSFWSAAAWRRFYDFEVMMNQPYTDLSDIEAVVTGFETCTTGKDGFRHADHLTLAVSYLMTNPPEQAVAKMKESLFRFLDHHGISRQKYHETLTVFWIEFTDVTLKRRPDLKSLVDKCNYVRRELADKEVVKQFYSVDLLSSEKARKEFVEPDLKRWS